MYQEFFGFSGKPFQLTPDLKFLYPSNGHKRAMSYLHYGLEQSEGFVVITGHIGTGKTMLIQTLLAELADQSIATAKIVAANLDENNIIQMVAASLGQPHEGKSKVALLGDLERSLKHAHDYLEGVLLIVDEAQTLTPAALEELRVLSNLELNGRALLQVFLVGQSELRTTLQTPQMEQLRQRVVASYHLEPLSPAEAKRYIGFRMVAVGWNGDPYFSNDVYDAVHRWTEGIPRKVNILMDRLLVFGYLEELREFNAGDVDKVVDEMRDELAGDLITQDAVAASAAPLPQHVPAHETSSELEERLSALEARLEELSSSGGPAGSTDQHVAE